MYTETARVAAAVHVVNREVFFQHGELPVAPPLHHELPANGKVIIAISRLPDHVALGRQASGEPAVDVSRTGGDVHLLVAELLRADDGGAVIGDVGRLLGATGDTERNQYTGHLISCSLNNNPSLDRRLIEAIRTFLRPSSPT